MIEVAVSHDNPLILTAAAWAACAVLMTLAWFVAVRLRFLSLVDAVWALGIGLCGASFVLVFRPEPLRALLAGGAALFWGLRLGLHLAARLWSHYPQEDSRYVELKRGWGTRYPGKSFIFFQLQAALQAFFSFPFAVIASNRAPFPQAGEVLGLLLFVVSVLGEAVADRQLRRFKADPGNQRKVCNVGLWRYSRHPNYFFEWLIWCGVALMASSGPLGWLATTAPALMLLLLLYVTGVAPSEAQALRSRGDAYRSYQRTTNRFIPWFPKGGQHAG